MVFQGRSYVREVLVSLCRESWGWGRIATLAQSVPGPRGVITVNGNTERSLRTEEHTAALAAEVQSSLLRQFSSPAVKKPDTAKRARSNPHQDRLAHYEQA